MPIRYGGAAEMVASPTKGLFAERLKTAVHEGMTMDGQLPPSKFGRGYTYGGKDQSPTSPQGVSPTTSPGAQPPPATFDGAGYQSPPPAHTPYAPPSATQPYDLTTPYQPTPIPPIDPYTGARATVPTWSAAPQQPVPGSGAAVGGFLSSGEGAPKAAAILSIVGALWAAVTVVQRWDQIKALFKFYNYASHLPTGAATTTR